MITHVLRCRERELFGIKVGRTSNIQPISPLVFELFLVCSHGINDSVESVLDSWKYAACVLVVGRLWRVLSVSRVSCWEALELEWTKR